MSTPHQRLSPSARPLRQRVEHQTPLVKTVTNVTARLTKEAPSRRRLHQMLMTGELYMKRSAHIARAAAMSWRCGRYRCCTLSVDLHAASQLIVCMAAHGSACTMHRLSTLHIVEQLSTAAEPRVRAGEYRSSGIEAAQLSKLRGCAARL